MFIREVRYYFMSIDRLDKEVDELRRKLESEDDFEIKKKYLEALTDVTKTLIRRYRKDDNFMRYVRIELRKLQNQAREALEEL